MSIYFDTTGSGGRGGYGDPKPVRGESQMYCLRSIRAHARFQIQYYRSVDGILRV